VDVAGLIASSLQLSNQDFLAGRINFSGSPGAGALQNQGSLTTPSGGRIYLIAPRVENSGLINAPNGDILLAAGHQVSLVDSSNPDLRVVVSAPDAMALNLGQIMAASGRIGIHAALLQQSGRISADAAVQGEGGRIFLKASEHAHLTAGSATTARGNSGGQVRVDAAGDGVLAGRVDVSASQGSGGQVQLLGKRVAVEATGSVDASGPLGGGQILVGGDYRGENPAVRSASQTRLDSGARLDADATLQGDGGKVIVWGNETTQAHGEISARGGARGGNGGLVETSAQYLDTQGAPGRYPRAPRPDGNVAAGPNRCLYRKFDRRSGRESNGRHLDNHVDGSQFHHLYSRSGNTTWLIQCHHRLDHRRYERHSLSWQHYRARLIFLDLRQHPDPD